MDDAPSAKQQIACTRSFGQAVTEESPLIEAVSEFVSRAAFKLRKQSSLASEVLVFVRTSPFRKGPQYNRSIVVPLVRSSANTSELTKAALQGLRHIYKPGFQFAKAGVMLLDLIPDTQIQRDFVFCEPGASVCSEGRERLMSAMDMLSERFGRSMVHVASVGAERSAKDWTMKQERRTPAYTTCWGQVAVARA